MKSAGRPKNVGKTLSDEQESKIIRMLIDTTPQQLKFKFALWTREGVKQLIQRELNVDMPISKEIYKVLYEGNTVNDAFRGLLKHEVGSEKEPG